MNIQCTKTDSEKHVDQNLTKTKTSKYLKLYDLNNPNDCVTFL